MIIFFYIGYWFKTDVFQRMIEQYQESGVRLCFFYDNSFVFL